MDRNSAACVTIKQEKDPLAPDPAGALAAAEVAELPPGEPAGVKEVPADSDQDSGGVEFEPVVPKTECGSVLEMPQPGPLLLVPKVEPEEEEENEPLEFVDIDNQLSPAEVKVEPVDVPMETASASHFDATSLPGPYIQPNTEQAITSTNYSAVRLNLPGSVPVPILYSPHDASLASALGSQAHLFDPLTSSIIETLPRAISDETIVPDFPAMATPAREFPDTDAEIKLEPEDSPKILPSPPARAAKPHSSKLQTKPTSVPPKNLPGSLLSKKGPPETIPTRAQTAKRRRNSDSSEEESSGITRKGAVTRGAKRKKDPTQEDGDSNAEDDPDELADLGKSDDGDFSDSEISWEGTSDGSEDEEDMEPVPAKTRAKKASSTITRPQEPDEDSVDILDENRLLQIFLDPSLVGGEGADEESDTRVPDKVPSVVSKDSEVDIRDKTERGSAQNVHTVLSSGGGSVKTYSRSKKRVETVVHGNATESTIPDGVPGSESGSKIKVESRVEDNSVEFAREEESELCPVEPKDESIDVTETTIQGYDAAMESRSKESQNLIKRFSQALTKTVEGLTSKANAFMALTFAAEMANVKKAEVVMNIFTETLKSLESCPSGVFANENGQTMKSNARCIAKQVYDTAVALRDKSDRANKVVNLTPECKETLQRIVSGSLKCMDVGTSRTKNRERALGESSRAGSEATDKDLHHSCDSCGLRFDSLHKTETHRAKKHAGTSPFACYSCAKVYATKEKLLQHMIYHGPKIHKCDVCGKDFSTVSELNVHVKAHRGQFRCHICGRNLSKSWSLKQHLLIHDGARLYRCNLCGERFRQGSGLAAHKQDMHANSRPYQCSVCSRTFKLKRCYSRHTEAHRTHGTHKCGVCQKMFASKSSLRHHCRYVHQAVKPYGCNACEYRCSTRHGLARHMSVHAPEAQFRCEVCQGMFKTKLTLQRHLATHKASVTAAGAAT